MDVVKKYRAGNRTVEICVDPDPENPRDQFATVGTMWCWHRRYQFGSRQESRSKGVDPADYGGWDELLEAIEKQEKPAVILPVYMYDHGNIALSTERFSCPWDSGQVGFIFARREEALEAFGGKLLTKKVRERVEARLKAEIETYSAYAGGDVFGDRVLDESGEEVESCWGYYGDREIPYMLESALGDEAKGAEEIR